MLNHAPGPWSYAYGEVSDYDGEQVALLPLRNQTEPEINGRLLAAAPELLEALQGVLLSENDTHRQSDDRWSVFRQAARAAIAKATGQDVSASNGSLNDTVLGGSNA